MKTIEELKEDGYIESIYNTLQIKACYNVTDEIINERFKVIETLTDEQLLLIDTLFLDINWTGDNLFDDMFKQYIKYKN